MLFYVIGQNRRTTSVHKKDIRRKFGALFANVRLKTNRLIPKIVLVNMIGWLATEATHDWTLITTVLTTSVFVIITTIATTKIGSNKINNYTALACMFPRNPACLFVIPFRSQVTFSNRRNKKIYTSTKRGSHYYCTKGHNSSKKVFP